MCEGEQKDIGAEKQVGTKFGALEQWQVLLSRKGKDRKGGYIGSKVEKGDGDGVDGKEKLCDGGVGTPEKGDGVDEKEIGGRVERLRRGGGRWLLRASGRLFSFSFGGGRWRGVRGANSKVQWVRYEGVYGCHPRSPAVLGPREGRVPSEVQGLSN